MTIQLKPIEIFPTPVFFVAANELNHAALADAVYKVRDDELDPSSEKPKRSVLSNMGGYHSQDVLQYPEFKPLRQFIVRALNENMLAGKWFSEKPIDESYVVSMWSIINQKGHTNSAHIHPHAWFSGVYYPKLPADIKNAGNICFKDPNLARQYSRSFYRNVQSDLCCFSPQVGTLIFFPGWLEHSVGPNLTDEDRIAIAFNIKTHPIEYK